MNALRKWIEILESQRISSYDPASFRFLIISYIRTSLENISISRWFLGTPTEPTLFPAVVGATTTAAPVTTAAPAGQVTTAPAPYVLSDITCERLCKSVSLCYIRII